ncbi:MAG: hypothetical protein P8N02_05090, partial [Actinomycetota bacterium]|nr:hypothetical protein [Actinomycetota bacterium]
IMQSTQNLNTHEHTNSHTRHCLHSGFRCREPAAERHRPVISVHDAASHSLAWIGSALGTRQYTLGVDRFGESGTIADLYELTGISAGSVVNAALIAVSESEGDV